MVIGYREPCMCGADDCKSCFPGNFINGKYAYVECDECGEEYHVSDDDDDFVCDDCKKKEG